MSERAFEYAIVGAGALGSLLAANLVTNGVDVVLVDDDERRRAQIEASGVRVVGFKDLPACPTPVASMSQLAQMTSDRNVAAILAVPPSDGVPTLERLRGAVPSDTPLLSVVGGLGPLEHLAAWPGETVLGVVNLEARLDASGNVEASFHNFLWLGNLDATLTPTMKRIQRDLAWVGPTLTTKAIRGMHWGRTLYALESSLPAIVELPPVAFFASEANRDVAVTIVREGIRVAEASGVTPIAFDFFDPNLYRAATEGERAALHAWIDHAWQRHEQFRFGAAYPFPTICGLSWSMSPRNPGGELEALIGEVQRHARAAGIETPALTALGDVARRAASGTEVVPTDLHAVFGKGVRS